MPVFSQFRIKAEGTGLEPARACARRFSKAVHYHSANPPLWYGTSWCLKSTIFCDFFKNNIRCKIWLYRLTVRTSAFQAGNPGSIPGRVTEWFKSSPEAILYYAENTLEKLFQK